jgi:hypothetical protein
MIALDKYESGVKNHVLIILVVCAVTGVLIPVLPPGIIVAILIIALVLIFLRLLGISLIQALIFLIPWQIYLFNWPGTTFTFTVFQIISFILVILQILKYLISTESKIVYSRFIPLLILIFLGTSSGLIRGNFRETLKFLLDWTLPVVLYWLIQANEDRLSIRNVLKVLLFSMTLQGMLGLIQFMISDPSVIRDILGMPFARFLFDPDMLTDRIWRGDFNWIYDGRVFAFGTFISNVYFALYTACFGCLALGLAISDHRRPFWHSSYLYASGLLIIASLASYKRTGWVAIIMGLLVLVALSRGKTKALGLRKGFIVFFFALIIPIALSIIAKGTLAGRLLDQYDTDISRINVWVHYVRVVVDNPFLGLGPVVGNMVGYQVSTSWAGTPVTVFATAENMYLYLALQMGIFSLIPFLWFVLAPLFRLWSARKRFSDNLIAGVFAWFAAYLNGSLFFNNIGDPSTTSFLVVMVWIAQRLHKEIISNTEVVFKGSFMKEHS